MSVSSSLLVVHFFYSKDDETLAPTMTSSGAGGSDLQQAALGVKPAATPAAAVSNMAKDVGPGQSEGSSSVKGGLQPDLTAAVVRTQATPSKGCTLHAYHGVHIGFTYFFF